MKHRAETQTFGRSSSHRKALYYQLTTSLIEHGRIETTMEKAKAIRGLVDQVITYAKDGSLHAVKQARKVIKNKIAFKRLFSDLRDEFRKLPNQGGYSRIYRLGYRRGDNAPLVLMELLNFVPKLKAAKGKKDEEAVGAEATQKKSDSSKKVVSKTKKAKSDQKS